MIPNSDFFVIAHNIRSLYNVGSIFRTADALGIDKIFLTGYTGTPKNPRLQKTALGAEKMVEWEYKKQLLPLIKHLKQQGVQVVALENNIPSKTLIRPSGTFSHFVGEGGKVEASAPLILRGGIMKLSKFRPKFPLALLLGEEIGGIKKQYLKYCEAIVEIPQVGQKESLNVSVAFGIAAYYLTNKI